MQKKLTVLFAFAIFVLVMGWSITPAQAHCSGKPSHNAKHKTDPCDGGGGGGGGGGSSIPVSVTFLDEDGDRIRSDGRGPYIDGMDEVGAFIRHTGDLRLNVTRGGRFQTPMRTLNYDFSNCVSLPSDCIENIEPLFPLQLETPGGANIVTRGIDLIEEIEPGTSSTELSVSMGINLTNLNGIDLGVWRVVFAGNDADCPGSANISITRASSGDTWEIEAGPTDYACLKRATGGRSYDFSGLYSMPFKITVVTVQTN